MGNEIPNDKVRSHWQVAKQAIFVLLAFIGGGFLLLTLISSIFFHVRCDYFVLSSAVSPNGWMKAEHAQRVCSDESDIEDLLEIGPARPGAHATLETYTFLVTPRSEVRPGILTATPLRIWWVSNNEIRVRYARDLDFKPPSTLNNITISAERH